MEFDPYYIWLGIPPNEQPANQYRLLGVPLFERQPDVIENAADRQMAHVRTFQTGPHSALSQKILTELAIARVCLLDPKKKAEYDAKLLREPEAAQAVQRVIPKAEPLGPRAVEPAGASPVEEERPPLFVTEHVRAPRVATRTRSKWSGPLAAWVALAVTVVMAVVIVGALVRANKSRNLANKAETAPRGPGRATKREPKPPMRKPVATPAVVGKSKRFPFEIPDPRRARWSIEGDELAQSSLEANMNILFGDPNWKDVDFSVEAKLVEGNHAGGLRFRYQDEWNTDTYWAAAFFNKGHKVNSSENGNETQPAYRQGSLTKGKWHRLEVRVRGKQGQCFLDGEQIMSFDAGRRTRGRVALSTWESAYRFRNIVVKAPGGKVLLEGLPDLDAEPREKEDPIRQKQLAARGGTFPTAADSRPLNFGFETGNLKDWTVEGDAFVGQPTKGDTLHARYKYLRGQHAGEFWIGGDEKRRDAAKGTLTSAPFKVTHPYATFSLAGNLFGDACLELLVRDSNTPFFRVVGSWSEALQPVGVDLREQLGKEIVIRVADRDDRAHVSFDDFRFHETKPDVSPRYSSSPSLELGKAIDVLKMLDIDRDIKVGQGSWDAQRRFVLSGHWFRAFELPLPAPKEYDLTFTVEGTPRVDDLLVILPIADRQVRLIVDGWGRNWSALQLVDGKVANGSDPAQKTSTHEGALLTDGQPNKLVCQVRTDSIKVLCNGATVIDWRGDPKRLSLEWGKVAGWDGILVGIVGAGGRFSQIDLTPISLQPAENPPAVATIPTKPSGVPAKTDPPKANSPASLAEGNPPVAPPVTKPPLPDSKTLQAAEQKVETIFGEEKRRAETSDEQIGLARRQLDRARWGQDEATVRYALARQAHELATSHGDAVTACRALELIASLYDAGDLLQARADAIARAFKAHVSDELTWANVLLALTVAEAAADVGRIDLAKNLAQAANGAAQNRVKSQGLLQKLLALQASLASRARERDVYEQALATLKKQPDTKTANLAAGRYEMLVLGDWKSGAARWEKLADPAVGELLRLDREAYRKPDARFAAARAWWDAASSAGKVWKPAYQLQAKYWCQRAIDASVPRPSGPDAAWIVNALGRPGYPRSRFRGGIAAQLCNGVDFQELRTERIDRHVDWAFGDHSPDPNVNPDAFSIRWTGLFKPPLAGAWRLIVHTDDGMRVWIDGTKVLDFWHGAVQDQSVDLSLADDPHSIIIEYNDYNSGAAAVCSWCLLDGGERGRQSVPPESFFYEPVSPYDEPAAPAYARVGRSGGDSAVKKSSDARLLLPRASDNPGDFADIVGEVAPGFTTAPPVAGEGLAIVSEHMGRKRVLRTHPVDGARPCVLTSTVAVPKGKKTHLLLNVSHHQSGDWQLIVKANGEKLHDGPVGSSTAPNGWQSLALDLTKFAGKEVALELHNHATGWYCENGFWSRVQVVSK